MSIINEIRKELFSKQDLKYQKFHSRLVPTIDSKLIIGVRTPNLRAIAKKFANHPKIEKFLLDLPHKYFDENQIHAFILSEIKDYDDCVAKVNLFLPFVDNWATCDQLRPKAFAKKINRQKLIQDIDLWIEYNQKSPRFRDTYKIRFGIEMLMTFFLDEDFEPKFLNRVAKIESEEYYLNMMVAWYFATALAKQWDATIPYIENKNLANWTHNKAIQKAIESYRITMEQKEYLRSFKCKLD